MRNIVVGLLLLSTVSWAQTKFQPLNVKPGLWETTMTSTTSGQMPIPAEFLNRMTPEQRAKFQERMKEHSAPHTNTSTTKNCETKEKLAESPFNDQKECKQTILNSTSTRAELKIMCRYGDVTSGGTMSIEALSPETAKGAGHMTSSGGGHSMDVTISFNSKWLSSSCGDVK